MFRGSVKRIAVGVAAAGAALGALAGCLPSGPPGGVTVVWNEAQLRAAFGDTDVTTIKILADITVENCDVGAIERDEPPQPVDAPVTLNGFGHTVRQTCADNVFIQNDTSLLTVNNLTITGGNGGTGGGIFAAGPLTIVDSTLTGNHATTGGGMGSNGQVTIVRSSIDANSSGAGGAGGISTGPQSPGVVLTDSTVSNNIGGGIGTSNNTNVSVRVVNSTISGNSDATLGGGIFSAGSTVLVYATVIGNQANQAFANIDSLTLESFGSVVAGGASPPTNSNCVINPPATTSHGYNFSDDDTCSFTAATDRENAGDPMVGQLADNGGPTQTMLPASGSPLLDWIPASACRDDGAADVTADQRGVRRPQGDACDIGSVEVVVPYHH
jgi:hypothetical protein